MTSFPDMDNLNEALRRGRLTAQQEAQLDEYLATHPEQRSTWEDDLALNQLLRNLPDAPVSSNFTARVLQAARQPSGRAPQPSSIWRRFFLGPRMSRAAVALVVLCAGLLTYQQHQMTERKELAQRLATMSRLATETPLELLENFDAIQRLNQVPHDADRELIAALQ